MEKNSEMTSNEHGKIWCLQLDPDSTPFYLKFQNSHEKLKISFYDFFDANVFLNRSHEAKKNFS